MIKYYCDICEKELKTSEEHFIYILPQRTPYNAKSIYGEVIYTYEVIEDKELVVCSSCRKKIAYALQEIKDEIAKKKS